MFAVIRTGGKQYRVAENDVIRIEKLDAEAGSEVVFNEVLMVGGDGQSKVGAPLVDGATVKAELVEQMRDRKVIIFKKRRRQDSKTLRGFRAHYTSVRIDSIKA